MTDGMLSSLKWTNQYHASRTIHSSQVPGDKILLPPTALEQLLNATSNNAAESVRSSLPQYDPFNSATQSAYRQAEEQYQDQRQQLPHPLTFRLVNPSNGRFVYAGIREFSSGEDEIVLSPFLQEALGVTLPDHIKGGDVIDLSQDLAQQEQITVHFRELPRGEYVKLRPLEAGYDPEDWKALLEQYLRANYTTLTKGEILVVPGGRVNGGPKQEYKFLVDGFKPDVDGICIVDTDLEVDIEALNEEQARETLERIAQKLAKAPGTTHGSSTGGEIDIFKLQEGQIASGEYVNYRLPSWDRTNPLEIELEADDGDETLDLLMNPYSSTQRATPQLDTFVFGEFEGRPTKRIRLDPTNVELEHAEALLIAVHNGSHASDESGSIPPARFTLRAGHIRQDKDIAMTDSGQATDLPPNEGEVRCPNCKQWVPQRTLMLHENFCLRNNILCPKGCGQVFQKRSPEFSTHWHCPHDASWGNATSSQAHHNDIFHPDTVLRCEDCTTAETFPNLPALARHRTTTCPGKLILCRFCHLVVPQEGDPDIPNGEALLTGLTPHELADGARTTECHLCAKFVRLRDMDSHLRNHDLDRMARPPPVPCRNLNCGHTVDVCAHNGDTRAGSKVGQSANNHIGLCASCFGPLYVSLHDPEGKALKRRIERRYLQQLTQGCGKEWCRNEYCKVGRKGLGLSTSVTMKDALGMAKPFLEDALRRDSGTPLHFCVDDASQKRRALATMLAAEDGGFTGKGGYDFEWCMGALEAESGDLDAARQWLKNWAPARAEARR